MATIPAEVPRYARREHGIRPNIRFNPGKLRGAVIPLLLLILWELAARNHWINAALLASPSAILQGFVRSAGEGQLFLNLGLSLSRMIGGWLIGSLLGITVGFALGLSRLLDRIVGPSMHAFRQIAPFAWIPLISVWCGLGDGAKLVFVALVVFFPVLVNTYEGIRSVSKQLLELSEVLMFGWAVTVRRLVLPSSLPAVLSGLELGFVYAWLATIGAEYLMNATGGLGAMMESAQESLEMDVVFVGVILSGLVGAGISVVLRVARSRLLSWRTAIV